MIRNLVLLAPIVLAFPCIAADKPDEARHGVLSAVLTKQMIERLRKPADPRESIYTVQAVRYRDREYLVIDAHLGYGEAYKQIGVYAPDDDGNFRLCLYAESCTAFLIKATVDQKTGMLELQERANSKIKGEVVLTCNIKTIGTQTSTRTE